MLVVEVEEVEALVEVVIILQALLSMDLTIKILVAMDFLSMRDFGIFIVMEMVLTSGDHAGKVEEDIIRTLTFANPQIPLVQVDNLLLILGLLILVVLAIVLVVSIQERISTLVLPDILNMLIIMILLIIILEVVQEVLVVLGKDIIKLLLVE
jgi:hypothetical protein